MSKKKRMDDPAYVPCARCGYTRQGHALANFADGQNVGQAVLICPFATWKEAVPPSPAGAANPTT